MSTKSREARVERRKLAARGIRVHDRTRYSNLGFKEHLRDDVPRILQEKISHLFTLEVKEVKCLHTEGIGFGMRIQGVYVALYFYPHRSDSAYFTGAINKIEFFIKETEVYEGLEQLVTRAVMGYGLGFLSESVAAEYFERYAQETGVRLSWEPVTGSLVDLNEGYDGIMTIEEKVDGLPRVIATIKTDIKYGEYYLRHNIIKPGVAIFSLSKSFDYKTVRRKIKAFVRAARKGKIPRV